MDATHQTAPEAATRPPPGFTAADGDGGPQIIDLSKAIRLGPEVDLGEGASYAAAIMNELRKMAAESDVLELQVDRAKRALTKARKDYETHQQRIKERIKDGQIPLHREKLRAAAKIEATPSMFGSDGQATPAAKAKKKAEPEAAPDRATQLQQLTEGQPIPPPPAQGFTSLKSTGFALKTIDAAATATDPEEGADVGALDWAGHPFLVMPTNEWGPGVWVALPLLTDKQFRKEGATRMKGAEGNGPLFGRKVKVGGKPFMVGPLDRAGYIATDEAVARVEAAQAAQQTAEPPGTVVEGEAEAIDLTDAVGCHGDNVQALGDATGEQVPEVSVLWVGSDPDARPFAPVDRLPASDRAVAPGEVLMVCCRPLVDADTFTGPAEHVASARGRDPVADMFHGMRVRYATENVEGGMQMACLGPAADQVWLRYVVPEPGGKGKGGKNKAKK